MYMYWRPEDEGEPTAGLQRHWILHMKLAYSRVALPFIWYSSV